MQAIFKKEMRAYFKSMTGYVFLAILILFTALYFVLYNVMSGYASYASTLSATSMIFLILIPVLTMRMFADEARQKTDQLLFTSPVTINQIVIGKFLAAFALFVFGMALTMIFPFIVSRYGTLPLAETAGAFVGFILLGACFISIGIFISALTDNQVVAAVASFGVIFLLFIIDSIASSMPADRLSSAVALAVIALIIAYFIYSRTHSLLVSGVFLTICAAIGVAAYYINPLLYDGVIANILNWFSPVKRYADFTSGLLSVADIVYYITFTFAFVYLTANTIEKKRWK